MHSLAPYRVTLLNRLSEIPNIRIQVLLAQSQARFLDHKVGLENAHFACRVFRSVDLLLPSKRATVANYPFSPGLWSHLSRNSYDLVVAFGWTTPNTLLALLHSKLYHTPCVLWETSTPHEPGPVKRVLMPAIRRFFGAFSGAFAASSACKEYLISMGARARGVVVLPQTIDNAYFARESDLARDRRAELKQKLGISTKQVILYCGRFVEGKGLIELLNVFARIAARNPDVSLLYVGEGPLLTKLEERIQALGLERVVLHDYVPSEELPAYYALADVFVLFSEYDTFGVVIAEAMACGLPILATPNVGAVSDLVEDGVNGLVVAYPDEDELVQALNRVLDDDPLRANMMSQSRRIISGWTLDLAAQNFCDLVKRCVDPAGEPEIGPDV